MKREGLKRRLAWAIVEELGALHAKTVPNVERYVIPKRTKYCIKKEEKITLADTLIALMIVEYVSTQKPIAWLYGRGQAFREDREITFRDIELSVT